MKLLFARQLRKDLYRKVYENLTDSLKSDTVHIGRMDSRGLHVRDFHFYFVKNALNGFVHFFFIFEFPCITSL